MLNHNFGNNWFVCLLGKATVFIVNHIHEESKDAVEKFIWEGKQHSLTHVKTIEDDLLRLYVYKYSNESSALLFHITKDDVD